MDFSISACPLFGVQFNDNPKNKTLAFNNKTITCYRFILPCKKKKATMIFLSLWLLSFYDKPKTPCFSAFLQYKRTQRLYHSLGAFMVEAGGIEPPSESSFMQLSTSVYYLLKFPWQSADKRAESQSSPNAIYGHGHSRKSFTANRCPSESRGTLPADRS